MTSYTNIFGGQTIFPAMLNLRQIALSANLVLEWPTETASTSEVVAYIMQVTPAAGSLEIAMPPADETSNGMSVLFTNEGASTYTVTDTGGNSILVIAAGETWDLWIVSNATANGTWNSAQRGATTGSVNVATLAGKGLKAITTTLNQDYPVSSFSTNYAASTGDRAKFFVWTSGAGDFDLDDPSTVGDGWFCSVRNGGDGTLTVTPASGTINGAASVDLQPDDSCMVVTDGSNYFTYGLGVQATFAFDFVSIDIAGSGNYTLTGAELNRIAYQFTGLLTGNRDIIVPSTTQQYWVTNDTTGAYVLGVRTSTQTSPGITVGQSESSILYCNGSDVVDGDTQGITLPISVADGGTGATTASGARTNLGATSVGVDLFTAANAAAGRTALALGTMSTQDATAVAIIGGTLDAVAITNASAVGLTSADAGAAAAPTLDLYRNSASPAASDVIGQITLTGEDSAGNTQTYGVIDGLIVDPTSTSEDGSLRLRTVVAGTVATRVSVGEGVQVGSPTGADKGVGTVNATGLFVNGTAVATTVASPVRQTVLSGPVDTDGLPSFGGSTGSTTVTASGTLRVTAASGFDANGQVDRVGSITNPSWTSLSTNGTMYLYLDVAADGTCTTGSTTLAPTYRFGGADVVTNLQNTFNIQEMVMKVGNGSTASAVYRVFVGEVTGAGAVVTAIKWYALMGRYISSWTATLPGISTSVSFSHNLGTTEGIWVATLEFECTTTNNGYAVGDKLRGGAGNNMNNMAYPAPITITSTNVGQISTGGFGWASAPKAGGNSTALTVASWKYRFIFMRGW